MTSTLTDRIAGVSEGLAVKAPVKCASTTEVVLAGLQTIDGISLVEGDRVLIKNQSHGYENGIYNASTGSWERAADFDGARDIVRGTRVFVYSGTINGFSEYVVVTADPIVVGTTSIEFANLVNASQFQVDTVVLAQLVAVPDTMHYLRTAGYRVIGDGGDGLYARSADVPSHDGYFQDAAGAYWELKETQPNIMQFGAYPGSPTANYEETTAALRAAQAYCKAYGLPKLRVPAGTYAVQETDGNPIVLIDSPLRIVGDGAAITAIFMTAASHSDTDIVRVTPSQGNPIGWGVEEMFLNVSVGGRHCIYFSLGAGDFQTQAVVRRNILTNGPNGYGLALSKTGDIDGFVASTVDYNIFDGNGLGGIFWDGAGDSLNLIGNTITGAGLGVYINSLAGAASNLLLANNITTAGGAIHIANGNRDVLISNQIEQNVDYTGSLGASITLQDCNGVLLSGGQVVGYDRVHCLRVMGSGVGHSTSGMAMYVTGASAKKHVLIDSGVSGRALDIGPTHFSLTDNPTVGVSPRVTAPVGTIGLFASGRNTAADSAFGGIDLPSVATPGSPGAGFGRIYMREDGATTPRFRNNAGTDESLLPSDTTNKLSHKNSVRGATTANIVLSGEQLIDGINIIETQRVLVRAQDQSADNGIYICHAGAAWSRASDADTYTKLVGASVWVEEGTTLHDTAWVCTADGGGSLGSTGITWARQLDAMGGLPLYGGTMTGDLTLRGDPSSALHAATKQYVDNVAVGLDLKPSVRAATTGNITLSGEQTIDGVAILAEQRVLVKAQSLSANNGVYVAKTGAWVRAADMDSFAECVNASVWVEEGTTLHDTAWVCTADAGGTLGSTGLPFVQFGGTGAFQQLNANLTAEAGLTGAADTLSYYTGAGAKALTAFTAFARALIGQPDAPNVLANLGVSTYFRSLVGSANVAALQTALSSGVILGGKLVGADMNSTADQAISIASPTAKFRINHIFAANASLSLTTAVGGIYSEAGKAGTEVIGASQAWSALTAASVNSSGSGQAFGTHTADTVYDKSEIYLSLSTPQGAPATADLYVYIQPMF